MAAIDKTYLRYDEYLVLKEWCKNIKLTYHNGEKGSPMDFLFSYNEPYEGEKAVWCTPLAFDLWLMDNCPLGFIRNRLKEQYSEKVEIPESKLGNHYKHIGKKPKFKDSGKWCISVIGFIGDSYWLWGWDSKMWCPSYWLMRPEIQSSSFVTKNLTKRKLNRLIKKWRLPIGAIVRISHLRFNIEYKIQIK